MAGPNPPGPTGSEKRSAAASTSEGLADDACHFIVISDPDFVSSLALHDVDEHHHASHVIVMLDPLS